MPRKQKKDSHLGAALIRAHRHMTVPKSAAAEHTHVADIPEHGRLQSVLELNDLSEFVHTAIMENRDFTAERRSAVTVVDASTAPSELEMAAKTETERLAEQEKHKQFMTVPRRPPWDKSMSADALAQAEREAFLQWRRNLSVVEQSRHLVLTPFEKNLEVWRQLWRVLERSDLVVQIVDARNPLMYRCADVPDYVKDIDPRKVNVLLVNKADYLPHEYRLHWARYFREQGVPVVFFSAHNEVERLQAEARAAAAQAAADAAAAAARMAHAEFLAAAAGAGSSSDVDSDEDASQEEKEEESRAGSEPGAAAAAPTAPAATAAAAREARDGGAAAAADDPCTRVLSREEMLRFFRQLAAEHGFPEHQPLTVGFVGYPNVGKSTTLNALAGSKRVGVSSTPGKTKHFQTIPIELGITLCDCPGLVFPSFAATKADMVVNGILPIDQMRSHTDAVQLVCNRIPRDVLETLYGITLPAPALHEPADRPPTASELLRCYALARGLMSQHGIPDEARAARRILKDYTNGDLLWCSPPPNMPGASGVVPQPPSARLLAKQEQAARKPGKSRMPMEARPRAAEDADVMAEFMAERAAAGPAGTGARMKGRKHGKGGDAAFTRTMYPTQRLPASVRL